MLWIDGIAALWQWRLLKNPQEAMRGCTLDIKSLSLHPSEQWRFEREAAALPPSPYPWHFALSTDTGRFHRKDFGFSVQTRQLPRGSFYRVSKQICIASPEFLFLQFAQTLPLPLLIKLGDELCGSYTSLTDTDGHDLKRETSLTTTKDLNRYLNLASGQKGVKRAWRALGFIVNNSASVKESELSIWDL